MVEFYFGRTETVDCTADPHFVGLPGLEDMYRAVWEVVTDPIVRKISSVELVINEGDQKVAYLSDDFSDLERVSGKEATGSMAKENKVNGLYLRDDYEQRVEQGDKNADKYNHLSSGVKGVREAISIICGVKEVGKDILNRDVDDILEGLENGGLPSGSLKIWIMWDFSGQIRCSDYIEIEDLSVPTANFSNQDAYVTMDGHRDHLNKLSELVNTEVKPYERF